MAAEWMNKNMAGYMATPKEIYEWFVSGGGYMDPCPLGGKGGLEIEWSGNVFLNPPYSKTALWVDKAIAEKKTGRTGKTVFLIPNRTETRYFRRLVDENASVYFFTGRLAFGDGTGKAPFGSVLIVLGEKQRRVEWIDDIKEVRR